MAPRSIGMAAIFAVAASGFMIPSTMSFPEANDDGLEATDGSKTDADNAFHLPDLSDFKMPDFDVPHIELPDLDVPHIELPEFDLPYIELPDIHLPTFFTPPSFNDLSLAALHCPGCSMFDPDNVGILTTAIPNCVLLDFDAKDRKTLRLGGNPLYPIPEGGAPSFRVTQIPVDEDRSIIIKDRPSRDLYYNAAIATHEPTDSKDKLINIWFHPVALDGERIDVGAVGINLIEAESGELQVVSISTLSDEEANTMPPTHTPFGATTCNGPKFVCDMIGFIEGKLSSLGSHLKNSHIRPCFGSGSMRGGPPPTKGGIPKYTTFRPQMDQEEHGHSEYTHHGEFHGHHGHPHHRLHNIAMVIHNFVVGFVIPVLVGIVAGMTASLVGMLVGTAVAWLWIRFVRKGKRGSYTRVSQDEQGAVMIDESAVVGDGVKIEEEAPPVYVEKE